MKSGFVRVLANKLKSKKQHQPESSGGKDHVAVGDLYETALMLEDDDGEEGKESNNGPDGDNVIVYQNDIDIPEVSKDTSTNPGRRSTNAERKRRKDARRSSVGNDGSDPPNVHKKNWEKRLESQQLGKGEGARNSVRERARRRSSTGAGLVVQLSSQDGDIDATTQHTNRLLSGTRQSVVRERRRSSLGAGTSTHGPQPAKCHSDQSDHLGEPKTSTSTPTTPTTKEKETDGKRDPPRRTKSSPESRALTEVAASSREPKRLPRRSKSSEGVTSLRKKRRSSRENLVEKAAPTKPLSSKIKMKRRGSVACDGSDFGGELKSEGEHKRHNHHHHQRTEDAKQAALAAAWKQRKTQMAAQQQEDQEHRLSSSERREVASAHGRKSLTSDDPSFVAETPIRRSKNTIGEINTPLKTPIASNQRLTLSDGGGASSSSSSRRQRRSSIAGSTPSEANVKSNWMDAYNQDSNAPPAPNDTSRHSRRSRSNSADDIIAMPIPEDGSSSKPRKCPQDPSPTAVIEEFFSHLDQSHRSNKQQAQVAPPTGMTSNKPSVEQHHGAGLKSAFIQPIVWQGEKKGEENESVFQATASLNPFTANVNLAPNRDRNNMKVDTFHPFEQSTTLAVDEWTSFSNHLTSDTHAHAATKEDSLEVGRIVGPQQWTTFSNHDKTSNEWWGDESNMADVDIGIEEEEEAVRESALVLDEDDPSEYEEDMSDVYEDAEEDEAEEPHEDSDGEEGATRTSDLSFASACPIAGVDYSVGADLTVTWSIYQNDQPQQHDGDGNKQMVNAIKEDEESTSAYDAEEEDLVGVLPMPRRTDYPPAIECDAKSLGYEDIDIDTERQVFSECQKMTKLEHKLGYNSCLSGMTEASTIAESVIMDDDGKFRHTCDSVVLAKVSKQHPNKMPIGKSGLKKHQDLPRHYAEASGIDEDTKSCRQYETQDDMSIGYQSKSDLMVATPQLTRDRISRRASMGSGCTPFQKIFGVPGQDLPKRAAAR